MKRAAALSLSLAAACVCAAPRLLAQATAPRFPASAVPARGAEVQAFVPAGWKAASQAAGDLDGDGRRDRVVHLVPRDTRYSPDAVTPAPEAQALLVLLAERGGGLRRAAMATRLLQTAVLQWELRITIRRGVLLVNQHFGLEDVGNFTHRFRREPATGRLLLIGRDRYSQPRPQGRHETVMTSENYLTGERLTTTSYFGDCGGRFHSDRRDRIPRSKAYFDDLDETPRAPTDPPGAADGRTAWIASPRDGP